MEAKKKAKKSVYIFLFVFLCLKCFSYDGEMSGEKNLRVTQTKWFDIIFPPTSETSAEILAKQADTIYEKIYASFDMEPFDRMPIVITPAIDEMNAYFAAAPYNHIVLYDTPPSIHQGASLAVFSESLIDTFRHECVHAVTFNLKNKGWKVVGNIFGDVINPSYLLVTPGISEGTAVVIESDSGEGRLNDGYSMHKVRQAKIEKQFPAWRDAQGASDLHPVGSHYEFNGAFYDWLQKKYGHEKFAKLWYALVNMRYLTFGDAFFYIYDMRISRVWQTFRDELSIPTVAASPLENTAYKDLFAEISGKGGKDRSGFSKENKSASRYTSLSMSEKGFACVDETSDTVLFFEKKDDGSYKKQKKLFRRSGITRINFSADGNFLAVSRLDTSRATIKNRVMIFDMRRRAFFTLPETSLRDAAIIQKNGKYYVAAVHTFSQSNTLKIYELIQKENSSISNVELAHTFIAETNELITSPVPSGNGKIAYILKKDMTWNVVVQDIDTSAMTAVYKMPDGMTIRSIFYDEKSGAYIFSCATKNTLPRLARLTPIDSNSAKLEIQETDVSGGVFSPVAVYANIDRRDGSRSSVFGSSRSNNRSGSGFDGESNSDNASDISSGRIFYSAEFYRNSRLLSMDMSKIVFTESMIQNTADDMESDAAETDFVNLGEKKTADTSVDGTSVTSVIEQLKKNITDGSAYNSNIENLLKKKYNPFKYFLRGTFLPFSLAQTYSVEPYTSTVLSPRLALLGLTYASSNPWSSSILILSAGFHPNPFEAMFSARLQGGTSTALFKYALEMSVGFDKKGYMQTYDSFSMNSAIPLGKNFSFILDDTVSFFQGHSSSAKNNSSVGNVLNSIVPTGFPTSVLHDAFDATKQNDRIKSCLQTGNAISAKISNIHKMGAGTYEYGGFSFSLLHNIDGLFVFFEREKFTRDVVQNIGFSATVRLPKLLPIICVNRHTYNLPFSLTASLFPSSSFFIETTASVILYSYEIQRALPFFSGVYFNRISILAEYVGWVQSLNRFQSLNIGKIQEHINAMSQGILYYRDALVMRANTTITPNFGMMASLLKLQLNADFIFYMQRPVTQQIFNFQFSVNFGLTL